MFKNYFFALLEGLKKKPGLATVKIVSLAIGLACSLLVIMHVQYSYSYDKHFPKWKTIYRLVSSTTDEGQRRDSTVTSDAYAPQMALDYPEIEYIAKTRPATGLFSRGEAASTNSFMWAEPDLIKIFDFQFISGDAQTALDEPNAVVLSESAAAKYFPGEDPLGQSLTLNETVDLQVKGVMKDLPQNTHFEAEILVSVATGRQLAGENFMAGDGWLSFGGTLTYLTVPDSAEAARMEASLSEFVSRHMPERLKTFNDQYQLSLHMEPLADVYLSHRQSRGETINPRSQILASLSAFAVLVLLTSAINFANLSLSEIQGRAKEIGVRKALGATSRQITIQFLFESLLLTVLALLIAAPLVWFAIPIYTNLVGSNFTALSAVRNGSVISLIIFVLMTGFLSGIVPALALARFAPATIIRGVRHNSRLRSLLRPLITVMQFGFSTAVIILAFAIKFQIDHLNTMDVGFTKENIVVLDSTYTANAPEAFDYDAMVNEIKQHPGVLSVAGTSAAPPSTGDLNPWRRPTFAPDEFRTVSHYVVSVDYLKTMQLRLLAGRDFQDEFEADFLPSFVPGQPFPTAEESGVRSAIITRDAVRNFGFKSINEALDEILSFASGYQYRVIGVVEDFRSLGGLENYSRSTNILRASRDPLRMLTVRLDPAHTQSALEHIAEVWSHHRPDIPMNRYFLDEMYDSVVRTRTDALSSASVFASIITVLISVLGLYALARHSTARRTKEVGVRKVLGATSNSVVLLLTWDFVKPVLVACAAAGLVAYFVINRYLQQFSSRVEISPMLYILVIAVTIAVAVLTVAKQCYLASNADPVKSLRYE